jgi:Uma2 family endonuclease
MSVVNRPSTDRVIVRNVSWETYERLLKDLENSSSPRLAYDHGVLEIMSPHLEHESANQAIATIIEITLEETDIDFLNAGSTTFKREDFERGFEPDSCFYIQNAGRIRGKKKVDMHIDPSPDLLIEVDLTHDSLSKFNLYAALKVPEVWRYEEDTLEIWHLDNGRYVRQTSSSAIPILNDKLVSELVAAENGLKRPEWLRLVRSRIRELLS